MTTKTRLSLILGLTLVSGLLVACIATTPEPTTAPTVATNTPEQATSSTEIPAPTPAARYVPDPAVCADLADGMARALGVEVTTSEVPFQDYVIQESGTACQVTGSGTGVDFDNLDDILKPLRAMILLRGWYEDMRYAGGGAGGMVTGFYRPDGQRCLLVVSSEPIDRSLCPEDEPLFACWEILEPEQKIYAGTFDCARDTAVTDPQPPLEATRVPFDPGATSARIEGTLFAGGAQRYVLTVQSGQQLSVSIPTTSPAGAAESTLLMSVWGADGTMSFMGYAGTDAWRVDAAVTQDYFVDVISVAEESITYTLEMSIPPAGS